MLTFIIIYLILSALAIIKIVNDRELIRDLKNGLHQLFKLK
jgi:hypothetical protein